MKFTRKDYLDRKCSHREYYSQFVNDEVKQLVARRIGRKKILASTDPHFNDIPLHRWDALAGFSNRQYSREFGPFEPARSPLFYCVGRSIVEANGGGVSPSDLVCVAKEAAQQIREEYHDH